MRVIVYPALQTVAVESQLVSLFLHLLQLLFELLDLLLQGKETSATRQQMAELIGSGGREEK